MIKRGHHWLAGMIIVLAFVILNLPPSASSRLRRAIGGLFLPLFGVVGSSQSFVDRASWKLVPRSAIIAEVEHLRQENKKLQLSLQDSAEAAAENARLRRQVGWVERHPWRDRLRLARVVGREPSTLWKTLMIDLGTREGIRPNQPVVTPEGLVGKIASAGFSHSQVVLIGDPGCGVHALVADTRDFGVLGSGGGGGTADPSVVEMGHLPNNPAIRPGQLVVTSGMGTVFPKEIPIGKIVDVQSDSASLLSRARVRLAADLARLEEVWVILK